MASDGTVKLADLGDAQLITSGGGSGGAALSGDSGSPGVMAAARVSARGLGIRLCITNHEIMYDEFSFTMMIFSFKNDELCIKNEDFCIKHDDFCIKPFVISEGNAMFTGASAVQKAATILVRIFMNGISRRFEGNLKAICLVFPRLCCRRSRPARLG